MSRGHSHRAFSGFLQGSTRVREGTTVLLISAFWLNVLWTEISTKWTHCAPPNHHIPRYSLQIISSVCSVPFWGRSAEPREGNILGLCVYLGRFHCRELFLRASFYVHSRLQLRQRRWEFAADRKIFDLTTKGNADSLTIIQVLVSHIFQHLGVAPKWPQLTKLNRLLKSTKTNRNGQILPTQTLWASLADSAEWLSANEIIIPENGHFFFLGSNTNSQTINVHVNVQRRPQQTERMYSSMFMQIYVICGEADSRLNPSLTSVRPGFSRLGWSRLGWSRLTSHCLHL